MSNDPRLNQIQKLQMALQLLGEHTELRQELIQWIKTIEPCLNYTGSIREDITGPIVDALHTENDVYRKTLLDGTVFEFLFRTKIARDFLLAKPEHPSHVWEPQTTRLLHYLADCKPSGDILVGGAYFGDHAISLGVMLRNSVRKVHCFEPNLLQAKMLEKNIVLNHLENQLVVNTSGLWESSSKKLKLTGFDSFANAVEAADEEQGFQTVSIDDYVAGCASKLSVLMLDIEGAEYSALRGAESTLKTDRPQIVFEVHRDYVDWSDGILNTEIGQYLINLQYQLYAIRDFNTHEEMGSRCIELIPVESIMLVGPSHGFNMLAITDPKLIENPLFRIVKNVSPKLLRHKSAALHHPSDGLPD